MLLENKFYKVLRAHKENEQKAVYHVAILPDCNVYQGHFPGNPVCPGVCNIQTIKECASLLVGKELRIMSIVKKTRDTPRARQSETKTVSRILFLLATPNFSFLKPYIQKDSVNHINAENKRKHSVQNCKLRADFLAP